MDHHLSRSPKTLWERDRQPHLLTESYKNKAFVQLNLIEESQGCVFGASWERLRSAPGLAEAALGESGLGESEAYFLTMMYLFVLFSHPRSSLHTIWSRR